MYLDEPTGETEYIGELTEILKKYTKCREVVFAITNDYEDKTKDFAYIDHQSSAYSGRNIEMFDDDKSLINFLFAEDSYIQGDNDNY